MFEVSDAESETLDVTVEVFIQMSGGGSSGVPASGFGSVDVVVESSSAPSVMSTSTDPERVVLSGASSELGTVLDTLTVTFAAFYDESVTVVVSAVDQASETGTGSVDVDVTAVNDRPIVTPASVTIDSGDFPAEGAVLDIGNLAQLALEDVEMDDLNVTVTSVNGLGTVMLDDSGLDAVVTAVTDGLNVAGSAADVTFALVLLQYQGNAFENGAEVVRYAICDGDGCLSDLDVLFTITSVETGPFIVFGVYDPAAPIVVGEGVTGTTVDIGSATVAATVGDDDDTSVTVTVTLSNALWSLGVSAPGSVPGGLMTNGLGTEVLTLGGAIVDINTVLAMLEVEVPDQGFGATTVTFVGEDVSTNEGMEEVVQVTVVEDRDAPVVTLSIVGGASVLEDDTYSGLGGDVTFSVTDVDTVVLTGTFSVGNGVLTVMDASNGDALVSGASVTVTGATAAELVATLGTASYVNDLNYHGSETLTVVIEDGEAGNEQTETVMFTVDEELEAPEVVVTGSGVMATEDMTTTIGLMAGVTVTDDESGLLVTTVTAPSGSLLGIGAGCASSFDGVGTNTLTTSSTGALSASVLTDCLRTLQFRPPLNVGGTSVNVMIDVDDQQAGSANGAGVVAVSVTAVDDAPDVMLTANAADAVESTAYSLFTSVSVSDVDSGTVTARVSVVGGAGVGTVAVTLASGVTFVGGTGQGEAIVEVSGAASMIALTLDSAMFTGAMFFHGTGVQVSVFVEDGTTSLAESVTFDVTSQPTPPTITYGGSNLDALEGDGELRLSVSGTTLFEVFDDDFDDLVVEVGVTPTAWDVEMTTGGLGLTFMGGSEVEGVLSGSVLSLSGPVGALTQALNSLTLVVPADEFDVNGRVEFTVREPVTAPLRLSSADAAVVISAAVTPVNDAPAIAVSATSMSGVDVMEDEYAGLRFAGVSLTDVDNGGSDVFAVTVRGTALGADGMSGRLRVKPAGARSGGEDAVLDALETGGVQGDGTMELTVAGTEAAILAVLGTDDLLEYRGSEDFNGEETLELRACDDGSPMECSAAGAAGSVVVFTVDAVEDEPEVTVGSATSLMYTETTDAGMRTVGVGASAMFEVSDAESETLDVTVEVFIQMSGGGSSGVPASGFGSVDVVVESSSAPSVMSTSTDTERVVLSGASSELGTVLDTLTVTFAAFYDESVTVVVSAVDQASETGTGSVDVDVTAVNDVPTVTPASVTIDSGDFPAEGAVLDIGNLAQLALEDVEMDDLNVDGDVGEWAWDGDAGR